MMGCAQPQVAHDAWRFVPVARCRRFEDRKVELHSPEELQAFCAELGEEMAVTRSGCAGAPSCWAQQISGGVVDMLMN